MKEKFVLYISGGAMRGVFGAGVATYLQESGLDDHIETVYASSAGSFAAAYLLSKQTRLGASIYYEDLVHGFISLKGFWIGIGQRLVNKYLWKIPKGSFFDALNLEHLFDVAAHNKRLDIESIGRRNIPFWIKVLDVQTQSIEYHRVYSENIWTLLRASVWTAPYVHDTITFNGKEYADATTIEPIGFEELRSRHPNSKIIIVFCGDPNLKWTSRMKSRIEGFFAQELFGGKYYKLFAGAPKQLKEDLETIKADPRTLLLSIHGSSRVRTRTRSARILKEAYQEGIEEGKRIEAFL